MIKWIKSKIALLLIGTIWGSLILLMLPLMVVAWIYDKAVTTHSERGWLYSLLIAQDHLVNAILGGHFLTTVSSLLGHLRLSGSATGALVADFVDWGFRKLVGQLNHCVASVEKDDVHNWSTSRALLGATLYFIGLYFVWRAVWL